MRYAKVSSAHLMKRYVENPTTGAEEQVDLPRSWPVSKSGSHAGAAPAGKAKDGFSRTRVSNLHPIWRAIALRMPQLSRTLPVKVQSVAVRDAKEKGGRKTVWGKDKGLQVTASGPDRRREEWERGRSFFSIERLGWRTIEYGRGQGVERGLEPSSMCLKTA